MAVTATLTLGDLVRMKSESTSLIFLNRYLLALTAELIFSEEYL